MAIRRGERVKARRFTLDQLQSEQSAVVKAAKQEGGAIVVDCEGNFRFSLCIPQGPVDASD